MIENEISFEIRGAIFSVFNELGPGLLESVYELALAHELSLRGLDVERQVPIPISYRGSLLEGGFRIDLLVNGLVVVEIKSIEHLTPVHHKQLSTYLKLANKRLGILVNFNTDNITTTIFRKVNGL